MSGSRETGRIGRYALVAGLVLLAYGSGVATGVVGAGAPVQARPAASTSAGGVLDEAADRIISQAASPVSRATLERAAIDGMLKALGDRWSRYFQPTEFESFSQGLEGRYSGVGAWLRTDDRNHIVVASVQSGSPAAHAGLLAGDRVVSVAGAQTGDSTLLDVTNELRGPAGSDVDVVVSRDGRQLPLQVTRGNLTTDDVTVTRLQGQIEVIRVAAFTRGVGRQVRDATAHIPDGTGVVLDLRANPGGLLDGGRRGRRRVPRRRSGGLVREARRARPRLLDARPRGGRGRRGRPAGPRPRGVVGSRTFGKGSVQEPSTLSDGCVLEITVGRYRIRSGKVIDGVGVEPDIAVRSSLGPIAAEGRAIEVLRGSSRPATPAAGAEVAREKGRYADRGEQEGPSRLLHRGPSRPAWCYPAPRSSRCAPVVPRWSTAGRR